MRLPSKRKVEQTKKAIESSKNSKKKKEEAEVHKWQKQIYKRYTDESEYKLKTSVVSANKLRAGMVKCCELKRITVCGDEVKIEGSWEQLITKMICLMYNVYGDEKFEKALTVYDIQKGRQLSLSKDSYEIVSEEVSSYVASGSYKTIFIKDIGYNLSILLTNINIVEAIVKLIVACNEEASNVKMTLRNKSEQKEEKMWMDSVDTVTEAMEMNMLLNKMLEEENKSRRN